MIAVDAAHWHGFFAAGVLAWLYRNVPGNLAASVIAFVAGFLVGRGPVKRVLAETREHFAKVQAHNAAHRQHMEWQAEQQAKHMEAHGITPDPHPVAGILDRLDSVPTPPVRSHKRKKPEDAA